MPSTEATLDITADTCPITFVRAKLALEKMRPGDMLRIRLREGEPLSNVPVSLVDHGHEVIAHEAVDKGIFELVVRRGKD
ncbi:sulfurtransferase TusA family protein [Geminicoccus harenae]|uniref:sulfurtransferase TusA family protein n=1 Tax=Geminicoccus harenae TaxID=2498453 RepID=UPI00168A5305|nr:sulfurtransferase TusA family protein [Geminicoccus harenae]